MSLIETVLSSIIVSIFLSVFVSSAFSIISLKEKIDFANNEFQKDFFIANSFEKIDVEENCTENIEEWKKMCESIYPKTEIFVQKIYEKEVNGKKIELYVSQWNGKNAYCWSKK